MTRISARTRSSNGQLGPSACSSSSLMKSMPPATSFCTSIKAVYQHIEAHMGAEAIGRFYATLGDMVALLQGLPDSEPDAG